MAVLTNENSNTVDTNGTNFPHNSVQLARVQPALLAGDPVPSVDVHVQPVPASPVPVPPPVARSCLVSLEMPPDNSIRIYNSNSSGGGGGGGSNSNGRETSYYSNVNDRREVVDVLDISKKRKIDHTERVEKVDGGGTSYVSNSEDERQPYESDAALDDDQSFMTRSTASIDQTTHGDQEDRASGWEFTDYPHEPWTIISRKNFFDRLIDPSSSASRLMGAVERLSEKAPTDSDVNTTICAYGNAVDELKNERSKRQESEKVIDDLLLKMSDMATKATALEREVSYLRSIHEDKLPVLDEFMKVHEQMPQIRAEFARAVNERADLEAKNQFLQYHLKEYSEALHRARDERESLLEMAQADALKFDAFQRQYVHEKHELVKQVRQFKEEAAKYQLLLGNATNVRWGDNDSNNSVQLRKDITKLQNMLSDFMLSNSKKGVVLKEDAVKMLLKRYNCKSSDVSMKPIFAAALQRRTIETVLQKAKEFLDRSLKAPENGISTDDASGLEARIDSSAKLLVELLNEFSRTREGSDNVTNVTPVKVRQQVFAVLGNRSFYTTECHPLISYVCDELLAELDQYREITSERRLENVKAIAPDLVHDIVRMFLFRFQAQEPPAEVSWYDSGAPTSKSTMQGPEMDDDDDDEDDEGDGQEQVKVVEICSFPLIGVDLDDPAKRQIISPARVHSRSEPKLSAETHEKLSVGSHEKPSKSPLITVISGMFSKS